MHDPRTTTLFCEHVRPEAGGKFSLIGVFTGTMVVEGELPARLSSLALINLAYPQERSTPAILRLSLPGEDMKVVGESVLEMDHPGETVANVLTMSPVELRSAGKMVFEIEFEGATHRAELEIVTRADFDRRKSERVPTS